MNVIMSNEMIIGIAGTLITGLFLIIGYFANKIVTKVDMVSDNVTKILAVQGIADEKLKSHEDQLKFLHAKQHDNSDKWTELWKDYDLHSIKHR